MDLFFGAILILLILNSGLAFLTFKALKPRPSRSEITKITGPIFIYGESMCCP